VKITKTELICISITILLVGFVLGFYTRDASIQDTIIIETEKTVAAPVSEQPNLVSTEETSDDAAMTSPREEIAADTPEEMQVTDEKTDASPEGMPLALTEAEEMSKAIPEENAEETGRININTASADELETLPGIGPVLAERIIAFREEYGAFAETDELMLVSGIGEKTYAKLKNLITVEE